MLGNRPSPGMAGPLLCWLHDPRAVHVRAAWWALQPKDWLRLRLTGRAATDPTDASGTLLFDLDRNAWADPLIEKLGLPREKLPPVRESPTSPARCSPARPPTSACRRESRWPSARRTPPRHCSPPASAPTRRC